MGGSNATLSIVLKLVDDATSALQGVSEKTKASLESIQSQADQVRNTFGLLGGAITAGLGVLVKTAADTDTAQMQLTTAVNAGVAAANESAGSTSALAKEKQNLNLQLEGVNAKLAEYEQKANTAKGANGQYDATIASLITKQSGLKAQLDEVNNSLSLLGANSATIANQFKTAADANTNLGFSVDQSLASFTTLFRATDSVTESMQANHEAMDLARAKGIDLASASTLIIQAMEGNSRALKQFGINLKDGLSPAEALQELQVKLAGSAQDYVNTPWGQMDAATAKTNMLAASLGNDLMPVLLNFLQTVTPLIQKITDWANEHPKLISYILIAVGAVGLLALGIAGIAIIVSSAISLFLALSTVLTAAGAIITAVGIIVAALSAPLIIVIALVALLAVGIYTHWNQIINWTSNLMLTIADLWNKGWTGVSNFFDTIWSGIKATIQTAISVIEGLLSGLFSTVSSITSKIMAPISMITGAVSGIGSMLGSGASSMLSMVPHFASGGIVNGPTMALVGEAGPEAIIPLSAFAGGSSLRGAGGSGGNIVVNVLGGNYLDSNGATMIANAIAKQIGRQLKVSNYN